MLMMLLTSADVCGRYFFDRPVLGAYDLTQLMMVVVVFFCIAYTQVNKGHVGVTVIVDRLPEKTQAPIESAGHFLGLILFSLIAWQSVVKANIMRIGGATTALLGVPTYPFFLVIAFGSVLMCLVLLLDLRDSLARVARAGLRSQLTLSVVLMIVLLLIAASVCGKQLSWQVNRYLAGAMCTSVLLVFFFSGMPIGIAMGMAGALGAVYLIGPGSAISLAGTVPYSEGGSYTLSTVPLFVLMGMFAFHAGLSNDLFYTAYKWFGRLPGGLAMAVTAACAGFGAVCGSSAATAATMGTVALPEMRKYGYSDKLATGTVVSAGTIGSMIPPSLHFIVYGMLTEQSIGRLFVAGIIPGILEAVLYAIAIYIVCRISPQMGPRGPATSFKEKLVSLAGTWQTLVLFLVVIGGIYMGVFTPTEAAGIGAIGAFIFALIKRRFTRQNFHSSLLETGTIAAMMIFILIGTMFFNYFLALSRLPIDLATWVSTLGLNRYVIMGCIIVVYLVLGCFMSSMAIMVLTVPVFFPLILALDFDPIWFGVMTGVLIEVGQITPPYGLNLFIVKGIVKDVPISTIYEGVTPFILADFIRIALILSFPKIALFLPGLMYST
jgi:tripartite ATP-independent transporter DctM subunit